jgi:hypothetical protein
MTQAIKAEPCDTTAKLDSKSGSTPINIQNSPAGSPSYEGPPKDTAGRIVMTQKVKIDTVEHLKGIPSCWPVPSVDTAYVLDFSNDMSARPGWDCKSLDVSLKVEVCDYHYSYVASI